MDFTNAQENLFQKNGSMSSQAGAEGSREGVLGWTNDLKIKSREKMKFRTEVDST